MSSQKKILIGSFPLRKKADKDSLSFTSPGRMLPFDDSERKYYLEKILSSLFIYDKVVVPLISYYEIEELFGIQDLYSLLSHGLIEFIDDGGYFPQVTLMVSEQIENDIPSYDATHGKVIISSTDSCSVESIEEKIEVNHKGKLTGRLTKNLIREIDSSRLILDGNSLNHQVMAENRFDFQNEAYRKRFTVTSQDFESLCTLTI